MKEFKSQVAEKFDSFDDPRLNWEFLKYKIRHNAKKTADTKKEKTPERKKKNLENEAVCLENESVENNSELLIDEYETAKKELDVIYDHITDRIILRSKAQWYEESEKSTKYFLSLEKSNKARTPIRKLLRCESSTEEFIDPKIIQFQIKSFYSKLYERRSQKTEQECLSFLAELNTPKLSVDDQRLCEGKLTVTEFWDTLSAMQNNKTPGMMA